ncbi:MAG: hypothetical protein ACHQQS_02290 [Thermoanaerobaculales bacterium]
MRHGVVAAGMIAVALLAGPAAAAEGPSSAPVQKALVPEYEVSVRDASQVRKLLRDNAWVQTFADSNLYRGTMVRLGPALFAVGRADRDGWQGRLVDFLVERLLAGRPMRLSYFNAPGLVSPFGITISGLSATEQTAAHLIVQSQRAGDDVSADVATPRGSVAVKVSPVNVRLQRFAIVEGASSLTISRDPQVAATLTLRELTERPTSDAVAELDLKQFFSAWSIVLEKLFGVGDHLAASFAYDPGNARFAPTRAELPLGANHLLGVGQLEPPLLAAIPADTLFFATVFLPDPRPFDPASVESYFRTARSHVDRRSVPVSFLYLGMNVQPEHHSEAMSVLLLPRSSHDDSTAAGLEALFNGRRRYEVHFQVECPGFVAVSPSQAALDQIAAACAGRHPSFRQMSPRLVGALTQRPVSAAMFLNVGAFLKSSLAFGWQLQATRGDKAPPPTPQELVDAMAVLDRLPSYAFAGEASGNTLVMQGAEP